jgi:hypothetical protein
MLPWPCCFTQWVRENILEQGPEAFAFARK